VQATIAVYNSNFQNRIVSSFDPDLGLSIDRNIGDVKIQGIDLGVAWELADYLSYVGTLSYNHAEVQTDTPLAGGLFLPTKGKRLVETPDWQWFQRVEWDVTEAVSLGVQAKWVGERFTTDVNDEKSPSYGTVDADLRWSLPVSEDHPMYIQLNVRNLFDNKYFGSITSASNVVALPGSTAGTTRFALGSPRSIQVTLHAEF
jgi:iron complex outermembrane receptor protein